MTFKFPPPPPPPPKATPNEQHYASQRGSHNRGGSERGRGRGGNQNRGGGLPSAAGHTRGGLGQNRGRGDARGRGQRGGYQNNRGGRNHTNDSKTGHGYDHGRTLQSDIPSQGHANPLLSSNATTQHHIGTNTSELYPPPSPSTYSQTDLQYSSPKHTGQKRKLADRNGDSQPRKNAPQQSSKPPRAKAAVPPQVPSFGFSLPPPPPVAKPDNKKRKVALGLSKQVEQDASSDEEDVDEEAAFSEKLKSGGFAFEHDGETISIQTGAEVAAWIKDRRKNFPTQKRITEKQEEAARKRMAELEFLRRIKGKPPKESEPDHTTPARPSKAEDENERNSAKQETKKKRQEELATLRKRLHESMVKKQSTPAVVDLGVGYDSETESDEQSSVLSESSVVSSSEESESESESDSGEDNEAPETTSSKIAPPPIKVPPAPSAVSGTESKINKLCTNWKRNGRCPYLSKCKYQHPPREENNKLPGLFERMVEQELVKADQLALDAIKYLGQNGFLG